MKFEQLWLQDFILKNLSVKWYTEPTQIQLESIKAFDEWKNILWQSNTWSGKTWAFAMPILNNIDPNERKIQALILTPTRELAMQIQEDIHELSKWTRIFTGLVAGGMSMQKQKDNLKRWLHIVVWTPGRVKDFILRKHILTQHIKYFVLDEADRMLDMWFVDEVEEIWSNIWKVQQTLCYSATINDELKTILDKHTKSDYLTIKVHTEPVVDQLDHSFIFTPYDKKLETFEAYLGQHTQEKIVIFTQTKVETARLHDELKINWFDVYQLHWDIKQFDRTRTTKNFKSKKKAILIATDVASRWLNFQDIDLVVNRDVPQDPESYIHRIGRTARAGKSGRAIMFVNKEWLSKLTYVEKKNKLTVKEIDIYGNVLESRKRSSDWYDPKKFGRFGNRSWGWSRGGFWSRWRWSDSKFNWRWGNKTFDSKYNNRSWFDSRPSYGKSRFDNRKEVRDKDGLFQFDKLRDYSLETRQSDNKNHTWWSFTKRSGGRWTWDRFGQKRSFGWNRSDRFGSGDKENKRPFYRSGKRSK